MVAPIRGSDALKTLECHKGFERKSDRTRKTDEGTRFSRAAIWGLLRLGINITGTISSVNPEGALWKLNG